MNIKEFFNWLSKNLPNIYSDKKVQKELSVRLAALNTEIRWEIGPSENTENFLAFSPNLNEELLDFTKMLVEKAPSITGWEFLPAKPRKRWKRRNIRIDCDGKLKEFNFDDCKYFLTSFNDGEFFDVNLVPNFDQKINLSDVGYVGGLFVEFELGEELYLNLVDRVNIIQESELNAETNPVVDLYEHIMSERK